MIYPFIRYQDPGMSFSVENLPFSGARLQYFLKCVKSKFARSSFFFGVIVQILQY